MEGPKTVATAEVVEIRLPGRAGPYRLGEDRHWVGENWEYVSIRPSDMSTMPEWQATRTDVMSGGAAHPYTGQVREAIVGEVRRDREGNLRWPDWWDQ
jgi:hypothetical protein